MVALVAAFELTYILLTSTLGAVKMLTQILAQNLASFRLGGCMGFGGDMKQTFTCYVYGSLFQILYITQGRLLAKTFERCIIIIINNF